MLLTGNWGALPCVLLLACSRDDDLSYSRLSTLSMERRAVGQYIVGDASPAAVPSVSSGRRERNRRETESGRVSWSARGLTRAAYVIRVCDITRRRERERGRSASDAVARRPAKLAANFKLQTRRRTVMAIDHPARDFSRPYAASSDENDRSETGNDRPAIAMTIVAASRPREIFGRAIERERLLAEAAASPQPPVLPGASRGPRVIRTQGGCVHLHGASAAMANLASAADTAFPENRKHLCKLLRRFVNVQLCVGKIEQSNFIKIFT